MNRSNQVSCLMASFIILSSPSFFFLRPSPPPPPFSFSTFLYSIDSGVTRHARDPVHMESLFGIRKLRYIYVIQSFSNIPNIRRSVWNNRKIENIMKRWIRRFFATSNNNGSFLSWILNERIFLYISYVYNTLSFDPCFFLTFRPHLNSLLFSRFSILLSFRSLFSIENKDLLFFFSRYINKSFQMITSNADEMSINVQQFLQDSRKLIGKLYRGKKNLFLFIVINIF